MGDFIIYEPVLLRRMVDYTRDIIIPELYVVGVASSMLVKHGVEVGRVTSLSER